MKANVGIAIAAGAFAVMCAGVASAQEYEETTPSMMREPIRAPSRAFELSVDTGYTQGFGDIADGAAVGNVADAGVGVGLHLGYRASPHVGIGASAQFQQFQADDRLRAGTDVRGMATSIEATFHFAPWNRVDPNLLIGTGYRLLWEVPDGPDNNVLTHGFQLAKVNAGLDIRVSPDVAIGPMIGADLNMFMWRNPEGPRGNVEIADKSVNTFIYAGLRGRFDVGGARTPRGVMVGGR